MYLKKMYVRALISTLIAVYTPFLFGQSAPVISLSQALDSVVKNYPGLLAKQMQLESTGAGVADARHQGLPSLKLHDQVDMGTANGIGGSYFPMGIVPSTSGGIRPENDDALASGTVAVGYAEYELYTFGMKNARVEAAEALHGEADADYKKTEYRLQYAVAQLYFNILKYNLLAQIQQKNIDRYKTLYTYITAYTGSGIRAGVDSSVANAEISKARIQRIRTMETLNQLKSEFIYYTGLKNPSFNVDTGFYHLPPAVISQLQLLVSGDSAGAGNPVLHYYQSRLSYSLAQEKFIRRSFLPKLYVMGGAWTRGSSIGTGDVYGSLQEGLGYSRYNYMLGLAFTYNIMDLVHRHDRTSMQYFQTQAVKSELQEQQSLLASQVRQSDIAIGAALDKISEIPAQLKASREAYSQKLAQYNAGLINVMELTNVSYLLYSAETDELDARSDLLNTLLQKAVTNNTLNAFLSHF